MSRVLAIDYGRARIGLALSDGLRLTARPLPLLESKTLDENVAAIGKVCEQEEVGVIVLGLPLRLDGTEGEAVQEVRAFQTALREAVSIPIEEVDERLTSRQAHALLKDAGINHRQRRKRVDSAAALLLLREFLSRSR